MLDGFTHGKMYPMVQRALRVLQMTCSIISMILYSIRINKLAARSGLLTHAQGAVEGILVAGVYYTICVVITTFLVKSFFHQTSKWLRYFLILNDTLFMGAFIAVSYLTRPKNAGSAGPCRSQLARDGTSSAGSGACKLPLGTFILGIIKVILFFLTAVFQAIRKNNKTTHHETTHHAGKHNNTYGMDGRDSATLHGRESTQVPATGHHNTGHNGGVGHHNNATPYNNNTTAPDGNVGHHNHGSNAV